MSVITIHSNIRDYDVHFTETAAALASLIQTTQNLAWIIDENVWRIYRDTSLSAIDPQSAIILSIHEEKKNLEAVQGLYDRLVERSAKRNMTMVSFGGGIAQDVTGFVASTLYRGVKWVFFPTTLLAQSDSCIGSKTSLNYKSYKNLIGTFYPPVRVVIDTAVLMSQNNDDFSSGMGEVIKLHMMGGAKHCGSLIAALPQIMTRETAVMTRTVKDCLAIKQSYIEGDEFDAGRRNLLNYGHCFGHAIESVSNFAIPHGQAVVLGIVAANVVARRRGLLADTLEKHLFNALLKNAVSLKLEKSYFDRSGIIEALKKDKKRTGAGLPLVVLKNGYEMERFTDVTEQEAAQALDELSAYYKIS